jgi:hypothetical protein
MLNSPVIPVTLNGRRTAFDVQRRADRQRGQVIGFELLRHACPTWGD